MPKSTGRHKPRSENVIHCHSHQGSPPQNLLLFGCKTTTPGEEVKYDSSRNDYVSLSENTKVSDLKILRGEAVSASIDFFQRSKQD